MKKLTRQAREWNLIHAHRSNKSRVASKIRRKVTRRRASGRSRSTIQMSGRPVKAQLKVVCPEIFSLEKNFDGVVNTLRQIRKYSTRRRNERVYIDFREIRVLSPSAALVLAAELDSWNKLQSGVRLRTIDTHKWDPNVRSLLRDMGFFDLLAVRDPPTREQETRTDTRYVKFRTGKQADGEAIDLLREKDLEPLVGPIPSKVRLYNAVTEAMTNVVQHAYVSSKPSRPYWWLSASHDAEAITIMIYDRGDGIPATLPRKFGERVRPIILKDHAKMIEAAHDLTRTRMSEAYRGHGLERDVRGYFRYIGRGQYRVISLKGEYVFERLADRNRPNLYMHSHPLRGTLIEWKFRR